jgi:regulator of protease activity HflC (stomatin/prohibitin superfamily)
MQPGLQWRVPVISAVSTWNTKVQTYTFENIEAFTSENQPALLSGIVNYHIEPAAASDLQQGVGTDYVNKLIGPQADSALKQKARSYTVDTITSSRDQLALAAVVALEETAGAYDIVIDSVAIRNIDLSKDYLDSVVAKQKAQQDVERAKAEANSAREKARGQADATVIAAEGQADANKAITASLTSPLIQWQYVQKLAPNVSVMMIPSGSNFIYPLPSFAP